MKYVLKDETLVIATRDRAISSVRETFPNRERPNLGLARSSEHVLIETEAAQTASDMLVDGLAALGAQLVFGLFGGGIAPFYKAVSRSPLKMVVCRSEGGAAFSAIEASLASGRLAVVACTTGPGITNLFTGMVAARWEGAKVLFISGCTRAAQRGRWAFQETGGGASPLQALFASGSLFHYAAMVEHPSELESALAHIAAGLTKPQGFVAHLGLPLDLQVASASVRHRPSVASLPGAQVDSTTAESVRRLLRDDSFVIWAGFGARDAASEVRTFAELARVPVMCSPRGKGIMPEDHPLYLGVTGLGGQKGVEDYFHRAKPGRVLVLGSRLGEMTSFWSETLVPKHGFIHVDVDPDVFGAAYPTVPTIGVPVDVGSLLRALIDEWPKKALPRSPRLLKLPERKLEAPVPGRVRPSYLMQVVQTIVVERTQSIVLTESGNSFALGNRYLRFREPRRYRVSTGFGSMGHAAAGVIGAALGSRRKAVAIVGDGAMLMMNEMSTAANYGLDIVWIILNDSRYGMIAQGMESLGWAAFETDFPEADFVAIANAMGASGIRVESELALEVALDTAMRAKGPFVVDVLIDRSEPAPASGRNQSLRRQTTAAPEAR